MTTASQINVMIHELREGIATIPKEKQSFAASLCQQHASKGYVSEKQAYWVGYLHGLLNGVPDFSEEEVDLGEFKAINALFDNAAKKLKYPALTFTIIPGHRLQLKLAGPNSSQPGTINVTDGMPYGGNKWYGRISKEGKWSPSAMVQASTELKRNLTMLLGKLGSNPAHLAKEHALLSGRCCFCNLELTDPKSVEVGYGPICAKNWNLPHGGNAQSKWAA